MKTIVIPNTLYEEYAIYKDAIDEFMPFALLRDSYNKRDQRAIFSFHDSCYIPPTLKQFISNIAGNAAAVMKANKKIIEELMKKGLK